jgi:hypothetical protein
LRKRPRGHQGEADSHSLLRWNPHQIVPREGADDEDAMTPCRHRADAHAPDYQPQNPNVPLQEFFGKTPSSWRAFTQITTAACTFQSIGTLQGPDADDE